MTSTLTVFRPTIPIGVVQPDGSVVATDSFSRWLNRELYARVGAIDADTNLELAAALAAALKTIGQIIASEQVIQPAMASPLFPDVMQGAAADRSTEMTFQKG